MNTTMKCGEDGILSGSLAGLLGHLRGLPRGPVRGGEALSGDADRFVVRLARHLRYSEETLFPALLEVEPGSACGIEDLEKDHRLLHLYARELGLLIRDGDTEGACGVARSFLAVLLDHLRREAEEVEGWVRSLDELDARRLTTALTERHGPAGDSPG